MADKLMVVIPCYNEEEVLPETSRRLVEKMAALTQKGLISPDSRVLLVDDGSRDRTWELISALHRENPLFEGVKLSRNRGHQNALLAGLMTARGRCDMSISMDADLQDDMDAMDRFIEKYQEGCDVVYGVRNRRDTDTAFKRGTALMFYRLMKALGVDITYNHADYRLMSARALEALSQFGEVNLFLRGLAPLVGFQSDVVTYDRSERFAGGLRGGEIFKVNRGHGLKRLNELAALRRVVVVDKRHGKRAHEPRGKNRGKHQPPEKRRRRAREKKSRAAQCVPDFVRG